MMSVDITSYLTTVPLRSAKRVSSNIILVEHEERSVLSYSEYWQRVELDRRRTIAISLPLSSGGERTKIDITDTNRYEQNEQRTQNTERTKIDVIRIVGQ